MNRAGFGTTAGGVHTRFMRLPLSLCLLLLLLAVCGPLYADQTDPRLDDMFAQLKTAQDAAAADRIEQRIWVIWRQTDNEKVAAAMKKGAQALLQQHFAQAEKIYTRVVKMAPNYAEGWNKRATARYMQDEYAASAADIRRTLALEPRHFGALAGLGLVYMKLGQDQAALDAFQRALEIDPYLQGARANIKRLRQRMKSRGV